MSAIDIPYIDLTINDENFEVPTDLQTLIETAIFEATRLASLKISPGAELSVVICGDETIRNLNHQWRDMDKPTNVLSFPGEPDGFLLGDIIVSVETTNREARLENKSFNDHFSHLIVHGFLHLFGYDHETEEEAFQMESLETRILNELGIADPYHDGSIT